MSAWRTQERTDSIAIAELASDPLHRPVIGAQLGAQRPHHPHRGGLLLRAVPTCRRLPWRLFLRHDSILVSKVRSLQDFQGDSRAENARLKKLVANQALDIDMLKEISAGNF